MRKRIVLIFLLIVSVFIVKDVYAKDTVNVSIKDIEVVEKNKVFYCPVYYTMFLSPHDERNVIFW